MRLVVLLTLCSICAFAEDPSRPASQPEQDLPSGEVEQPEPFQWGPALAQSSFFLGIEHAFRFVTEPGTRKELQGPFLRDYMRSIQRVRGWGDGDPFLVNYIGHPFQGAVAGYIQVQNDPSYRRVEFGNSPVYWRSRLRAMAFSAAYSAQFEVGPLSEASLGNVGLDGKTAGACDLIVTPTAGFGVMMAEDALDRYLVRRIEKHTANPYLRLVIRSVLNPNRSLANMLRFKRPWHRDHRGGVLEP